MTLTKKSLLYYDLLKLDTSKVKGLGCPVFKE